mgnify:CR=1 FL=1
MLELLFKEGHFMNLEGYNTVIGMLDEAGIAGASVDPVPESGVDVEYFAVASPRPARVLNALSSLLMYHAGSAAQPAMLEVVGTGDTTVIFRDLKVKE